MLTIETAGNDQIPVIINIAENTWWRVYESILSSDQIRYMLDTIYAPSNLSSQIESGAQTYLILRDDGEPVGFASYSSTDQAGVGRIHKLYVLPEVHKKGCGRKLVEEVATRLRALDMEAVELNVNRFNPAKGFYERLGFQVMREEDVPVGPYWMNDYVMRMTL
jgi:ribosomal protein S18 acetylase RimI-like enzyme